MPSLPAISPPPVVIHHRSQLVIVGFLGAGKTTLLRQLLGELQDHGITSDVILNDYENAELDAETLREKAAAITPLSATCACCGGLDDMVKLALASQDSKSDCLLVELNGTADPIPLIETFTLLEEKIHLRPRWQITVIDARKFGRRDGWQGLEDIQLATATHYLISHRDEVEKPRLAEVRERVRRINPHARNILAPMLAGDIARAVASNQPHIRTPESFAPPESKLTLSKTHGHPLTHAFNGCRILLPRRVRESAMREWLRAIPPAAIRVKALVTTREAPEVRHLFERIGSDEFPRPAEVPISGRVPPSAILIGPGLDPAELLTTARQYLGDSCTLATI